MKIIFPGKEKYTEKFAIRTTAHNLSNVLKVNKWEITDTYNIDYDELDGVKRIVITREENG